ncbi:carnosine dipeptidase 1 (metallopeptidase M20 family), isoform CRA_b, partial [Mus musculus]
MEDSMDMSPLRPQNYLFGCELKADKDYHFKVDNDDNEHQLSLRTVSLGAGAKDELHITEAEAMNDEGSPIKKKKTSTPRSKGQESFKKQEKTPKTPKGPSSVEDIKAKMQAIIKEPAKVRSLLPFVDSTVADNIAAATDGLHVGQSVVTGSERPEEKATCLWPYDCDFVSLGTAAVGQSQASSLSALQLEQAMFSSAHSGLLEKLFHYIDLHQDEFVQTLKEWVAIESDSVQPVPRLRQKLFQMMALAADKLRNLGAGVESIDLGSQQMPDGQSLPIPPILLAELGSDPEKPTVCFYGHLDVQPAQKDDGWLTDPYTLTEVDGKLYGRGATDNKGPVLAWINAVSTFRALQQDLPVNIKLILEGMEEAGSIALEELVMREKDHFFSSVDYIVISDNLWLSQRKPALTYGTRGNCYFTVEVKCRDQDFHSGTFGGILNEPMADLVALLEAENPEPSWFNASLWPSSSSAIIMGQDAGSLVDSSGHILIPGIYDQMAPITEGEKTMYKNIDMDLEEYQNINQVEKFLFDTKVTQHLEAVFSKRNSFNKMAVSMVLGLHPWTANVNDTQYLAAQRTIKTVFGVNPDMIRDGSTIPIAKIFQAITQKSVMMLPLGAVDDGEHSQNEKINRFLRPTLSWLVIQRARGKEDKKLDQGNVNLAMSESRVHVSLPAVTNRVSQKPPLPCISTVVFHTSKPKPL